jgi:hypothetical protein
VAGSCECGDESLGSYATELVISYGWIPVSTFAVSLLLNFVSNF